MKTRQPGNTETQPPTYSKRISHYETEEGAALLKALARRRGVSTADLLRRLTREEAQRAGVNALDAAKPPLVSEADEQAAARERLREMVVKARSGAGKVEPDAVRQEVTILRAGLPPPGPQKRRHDPARTEYLMRLVEQVRAGVPEEWSEEEILRRVEEALAEVRAGRASHG
jgi:hypothetical protein